MNTQHEMSINCILNGIKENGFLLWIRQNNKTNTENTLNKWTELNVCENCRIPGSIRLANTKNYILLLSRFNDSGSLSGIPFYISINALYVVCPFFFF